MTKRIRKARTSMLLQSQVEQAIKATRSNRAAAEYLRVSYPLYRKFAKSYKNKEGVSLFQQHFNQSGKGIPKTSASQKRWKIDDILAGKHPEYPRNKLLQRLFISGYFSEKCSNCGFCEKREKDAKSPLILNHLNGDVKDHEMTNLEVLCYNCYFVLVGNIGKVDLRAHVHVLPDRLEIDNPLESPLTLDVLSEEEKLELIESLKNT